MVASLLLIIVALHSITLSHQVFMNKTGCGDTKACLFRPAGCDPNQDCTTGVIFYVVGTNQLRVEMVATALIPAVQQQYIALAFSNDEIMGDDSVIECVMSDMGQFAGYEPEIFVSFNKGKSNDRIFLNTDEQRTLITDVASEAVDGRIVCQFTQQIIPQIDTKNGLIWPLNKEYFIMAATGSAQPDEVNPHDMNRGSHFYPIISSRKVNPSKLTDRKYVLPDAQAQAPVGAVVASTTTMSPTPSSTPVGSAASVSFLSVSFLISLLVL